MKKYLQILIAIICLFLIHDVFAYAQEIEPKTPEQSDLDFEAQMRAHPERLSYDEDFIQKGAPHNLRASLKASFIKAQDQFLKSELSQIESNWRDVAAFALKADWGANEREMIQIAFLRLAQMAENSEETRKHLIDAINFDSHFSPDSQLFPPPITDQYRSLQKQSLKTTIEITQAQGFSILLINGVRFNLKENFTVTLTPGTKRVTFVSPTYEPVTRILSTRDIAQFTPQKTELAIVKLKMPIPPARDESYIGKHYAVPSIETKNPIESEKSLFEKPKFWVGAAIVTAAVLYVKSQTKKENESSPTHREGF